MLDYWLKLHLQNIEGLNVDNNFDFGGLKYLPRLQNNK